jgi:hypothetical protein
VLALEFEEERHLVRDLVPAGAVGLIAGVPETHKSFLGQAIVVRVAQGNGEILGHAVASQAPTGYFWQDDSTREEADRVKLYEQVHASPPDLPVRWFLNEGLELPRDLELVRATIMRFGFRLVVLDSFCNVALVDLKDRDAGKVVAALKSQVCDQTGCTVLIVDHMPWATDNNRLRLRSYGDVFKDAAARFTSVASSGRRPTGTRSSSSFVSATSRRWTRLSLMRECSPTWRSTPERPRNRSRRRSRAAAIRSENRSNGSKSRATTGRVTK